MPKKSDYLKDAGRVVRDLQRLGLHPVLIGGMALVILGSQRVTRDFDFVVSQPEDHDIEAMVKTLYRRGLELASRLNKEGEIVATIDNPKVAAIRLRLDRPPSAYFLHPKTGLRIDLLFDFPLPALGLRKRSSKMKIKSQMFYIASEEDLLRLKEIAQSRRSSPGDPQDIAFLKARRGS